MKLYYCRTARNFGDDLNVWLWEKALPGFLDNDERQLFIGMGTILGNDFPREVTKIVVGSGGGYATPPKVDDSWKICFVRGPLTADLLRIDRSCAITDPAVLVNRFREGNAQPSLGTSLMMHQGSIRRADWRQIAGDAGIHYIDPEEDVMTVLEEIGRSELLITEAMHGAIVADALGIPWIPVQVYPHILPFKWHDWCLSMGISYMPLSLKPIYTTLGLPRLIKNNVRHALSHLNIGTKRWKTFPVRNSSLEDIAQMVAALRAMPRSVPPILSSRAVVAEKVETMLEKLRVLRIEYGR